MMRLWCMIVGHRLYPTGREGSILVQVRCHRCDQLYVRNVEDSGTILPHGEEFERCFVEREQGLLDRLV